MMVILEADIDYDVRCWRCRRKIAEEVRRPWAITCQRCHAANYSQPLDNRHIIKSTTE